MKALATFLMLTFSTASLAGLSKCEQKIQALMLASEQINYPQSAQTELSTFKFEEKGDQVSAVGMIYVYNGDTIYRATGHRLIYGDPKDCVIKELKVEVLP